MTKPTLSAAALALMVLTAGCPLERGDVTVRWTIEGSDSASLCGTYGIDRFRVRLGGRSATTRCVDMWEVDLRDVVNGQTDLTLEALDAGSAVIARRTISVHVDSNGYVEGFLEPSDFGSGGGARIGVLWNINGTVDGTDKGLSWDRCAEVGAKTTVIKVNGVTNHRVECDAGGAMSTTLEGLRDGETYYLEVKLQDAAGKDLTTAATGNVIASKSGGQFVVDFFYDSFHAPLGQKTKGVFQFKLTFANKGCGEHSPAVGKVRIDVTDAGSGFVDAQVCNADGTACVDADGFAEFDCSDALLKLSEAVWGNYTLRIEGFDVGSGAVKADWSKRQEILIGAGDENPVVTIDVPAVASP